MSAAVTKVEWVLSGQRAMRINGFDLVTSFHPAYYNRMKVFISHALEDREAAAFLARQLQREGFTVWTFNQIEPGENWAQRLGKEIATADFIVFLMTDASARSEWVRHDVEFVLTQEHYKNHVVTAILDATALEHVPWILRSLPCVQTDSTESGIERVTKAVLSMARNTCHAD